MHKLLTSDKIYISQSNIHKAGRGVFARIDIKKNEIIERCPAIEVLEHDISSINESILATYVYSLGKHKDRLMIALGFGSLYNHTDQPNAKYREAYKENVIDFIAIKDIKKDEEITVNYNQGNQKNKSPLWLT